nr:G protein-coupled receptor [Proales similis]
MNDENLNDLTGPMDNLFAILVMPMGTFFNVVTMLVIYKHLFNRSTTKIFFLIFLLHSTLSMNLNMIAFFVMKFASGSFVCVIFSFISHTMMLATSIWLVFVLLDRFIQLKCRYINLFKRKHFPIIAILAFMTFAVLVNLPHLMFVSSDALSFTRTVYYNDCQRYHPSHLFWLDLVELLGNVGFQFVLLLVLDFLIAFKLIHSKRFLQSLGGNRHRLVRKEKKFILFLFLISILSFLLSVPYIASRIVKHYFYISVYRDETAMFILTYLESLFSFLRNLQYLVPFLLSMFMNPFFRKRFFSTLIDHS